MIFLAIIFHLLTMFSSGSRDAPADASRMSIDQKLRAYQLDKKDIEVFIDKTAHTLTLQAGNVILKKYKCVFGTNPISDKRCEGDRCTPEGVFHIQAKYPHKDWDKFMLLDYPTAASWKQFEYNKAHGRVSPDANIGGSIGIHGIPQNKPYLIDRGINWTLGCISLSNADVDEIYRYIDAGTKVTIYK